MSCSDLPSVGQKCQGGNDNWNMMFDRSFQGKSDGVFPSIVRACAIGEFLLSYPAPTKASSNTKTMFQDCLRKFQKYGKKALYSESTLTCVQRKAVTNILDESVQLDKKDSSKIKK